MNYTGINYDRGKLYCSFKAQKTATQLSAISFEFLMIFLSVEHKRRYLAKYPCYFFPYDESEKKRDYLTSIWTKGIIKLP